ncbi:MAG: hypothetical protein ACOCXA_06835, partial [Planctomycetota bacterium]
MLVELRVQNLVIIEEAVLRPGQGLCVISGETGAGKSLLMDALGLLRGNRADSRLVGPVGEAGQVAAVLEDCCAPALVALLREQGIPCEDQLILRRRITRAGRSQAWINDVPVGVGVLRSVGEQLFDIRGQHEHVRLAAPERQRELLDAFGGHGELAACHHQVRQQLRRTRECLQALRDGVGQSLRERDYCRFLLDEIEALQPQPGELAQLEQRQELLADAELWRERSQYAASVLYDSDDAVASILGRLMRDLGEAPLPDLQQVVRQLGEAQELVRDAAMTAMAAAEQIDADPAAMALVEQRLGQWQDLLRKHGGSEDALLVQWRELQERYDELAGLDETIARLEAELHALQDRHAEAVAALRAARAAAFDRLAEGVHRELKELGMPKARLALHEHAGDGADVQELLLRTNPGLE